MTITLILSITTLWLACIAGAVRCHRTDTIFLPFLCFLWLGGINEFLSLILWINKIPTTVNNNFYVLFEVLLLIYFFRRTDLLQWRRGLYSTIILSLAILWVLENIVNNGWLKISFIFRIVSAITIILISFHTKVKVAFSYEVEFNNLSNRPLYRNPLFLICIGLIIFFTFKLLIEIYWLCGLDRNLLFKIKVYNILNIINIGVNLLYSIAILWIPPKQQYSIL